MRKSLGLMAALAIVASLFVGNGSTFAASPNAAVVINDQGCSLHDGDGNSIFVPTSHVVITSNGHGLLVCKAKGVPNSTGHAVRFDQGNTGSVCGFEGGVTDRWQLTVSASGNATLSCHVG